MKKKIVVIGNGMVGHYYVEKLLQTDLEVAITVIGAEPRPAYDRVHLSEYFSGKKPEELALTTREFYLENGVQAYFGDPVNAINTEEKSVTTAGGMTFQYDQLVLATGSYAFVPPIPGNNLSHCLTYRTIDDLGEIKTSAEGSKVGVVVGGGLLGLECANALMNLGLETHVIEFAPGLMNVQLDNGGSQMLRKKIEALGVHVHSSKATQVIKEGETCRLKMVFADGGQLETDMIVFSAGIRPYDQLAKASGLKVGERGGIIIDYNCRTSDKDIFAIGECALWGGRTLGLVAPGYRMAEVAISQLTDDKHTFKGADMSTKLKLLGVDVGSIGDSLGQTKGTLQYQYNNPREEVYKSLVVSEDGKKLLGAVLVGDCSDYDSLLQYYLNGIDLPDEPELLILPALEGRGPVGLGVDALPDTAQICSCNNVSKGELIAAIDGGAMVLSDLKACTKAGTTCGGCAVMVGQILNSELEKRGVEVNRDICEHFPYTRQDLYMIVRAEQIKSFEELIERHGTGRGCDICKPAVGSILASCWNEYVLKNQHAQLQDSNDHFLANTQKDGTYSIVPRVAGGEITPEKLIVIGEVAKKYGLYTKITGGQRVDLFGATVDQLPLIWKELVDAGFESGHAYAKALRTVKSCVGSTWCRYGVQDSVKMAIDLENRYKGLRAPHKIKMAVSGCTRECAEAQGKDVGVIATEKGWNMYVCGNGGMKPRHADLFASDLDDKTLIKYIDRFYMFYIRTADRLQRTSTWMDNLEDGLEFLKEVIIDDKLGICDELEKEMTLIVGTYECEWKKTINDPERLKLFRTFVNSDKKDNNVVFVHERNQIRPATAEEKQHLAKTA